MFAERIIRWSGLALALGGVLAALFWILHPEESVLLTDPVGYQGEHLLDFIGLLLLIPGFMGLYSRISNRTGWLGFAGFLLTLMSLLILMGVSVVDMLIWPAIAQAQPDLILTPEGEFNQSSGPFAATIALIVPFAMIGSLGYILLGIAIWRSDLMPRWVGLLLAIGGPLYLIGPGFVPHTMFLLNLLVYVPFAGATVWLGIALWNRSEPRETSMPVRAERALLTRTRHPMLPYKLTDPSKLTDARTALICARLYLRGGKRRLQAGYSKAGIEALYDAVLFGMRYYIARHKRCEALVENTDPWDAPGLFHALARAGVFDDPLLFHRFSLIVERALWQESHAVDVESTLAEAEKILVKLGVIPMRDSTLPNEPRLTH